jgi:hypothetical protein
MKKSRIFQSGILNSDYGNVPVSVSIDSDGETKLGLALFIHISTLSPDSIPNTRPSHDFRLAKTCTDSPLGALA